MRVDVYVIPVVFLGEGWLLWLHLFRSAPACTDRRDLDLWTRASSLGDAEKSQPFSKSSRQEKIYLFAGLCFCSGV
jgi:hypothetical protein